MKVNSLSSKSPFIITIGHEKGGTGKSTISTHLSIGLTYRGYKICLIDLDMRQNTSFSFFKNREHQKNMYDIQNIEKYFGLYASENNNREEAFEEDFQNLINTISKGSGCDFIILDTAGSNMNFSQLSLRVCDLLLTPLSDSFIDINVLISLDEKTKRMHFGSYASTIFNQKKYRIQNNFSSFKWMVIRNKTSPIISKNTEKCLQVLDFASKKMHFEIFSQINDRLLYKEIFNLGLTIFDIKLLFKDINFNKESALIEQNNLINRIIDYKNS